MDYIFQRPSGYYFRLMVPSDLIPIIETTEIRRSLKTGSLCLAKERANLLSGRLKKLFRKVRYSDSMKLKKEHITGLVKKYVAETLESEEDERLMLGAIPSEVPIRHPMMSDSRTFTNRTDQCVYYTLIFGGEDP